jgi:hypothetical protein
MGSNLDCEGLGRFATVPQSRAIMPTKQYHVQRMVPLRTEQNAQERSDAFSLAPLNIVSSRAGERDQSATGQSFLRKGAAEGRGTVS